ncbi:MAG: hypothetical protein HBSAPP03_21390 [Phycisphaerae bacterium]|nr:MAG: hypothetical protein HBSAPP03_21390 [Phycisphaerae bacterium]
MSELQAIAHYLIEKELGRGAMGVVYLAHDTKLGRSVAVKSLPADLAEDLERRQRFEEEARTLAAINHPNIASIYGLEQQDGLSYLVLEYVEGPTLTHRITEKSLSIEESLVVCRQVAAGIEAAHQRGIIHRDLKPENIKLRPDGVVKVLDFGIAMGGVSAPIARSDTPTIAIPPRTRRTAPGLIVGTPGYMSPEQARGKPVSPQTDIWALACVLYECLTGSCVFAGESLADALAATLHAEPDWTLLPPRTPARTLDLLRRSLSKDAAKRPSDMASVRELLDHSTSDLKGVSSRIVVSTTSTDDDWPAGEGNLATPATPIIGRERELGDVTRALAASRLVTLTGPTGAGRSTLALAVGQTQRANFTHGAWFARVPFGCDAETPAILAAIALGARGGDTPTHALAARIAARPVLLVLAGCEHAPTACSAIAQDILGACPNLRLIVTARAPLGIEGEAVLPVGALAAPSPGDVARGQGRLDAARLFVEKTKLQDASFTSTADSTHAIAELCRRLGGWPLAVELAASLTATMSVADVGERLEQRARLLGVSGLEVLPAEGVHRLMIRWILDTLPPGELAVLLAAWAFVGPTTARGLTAAGGARDSIPNPDIDDPTGGPTTVRETKTAGLVAKLLQRGMLELVTPSTDPARVCVRVHDAVRQVAGEWLRENSAVENAVITGHRAYIMASADQASRRWAGPGGALWLRRADAEYADLAHAVRQTRDTDAASLKLKELMASYRKARGL